MRKVLKILLNCKKISIVEKTEGMRETTKRFSTVPNDEMIMIIDV